MTADDRHAAGFRDAGNALPTARELEDNPALALCLLLQARCRQLGPLLQLCGTLQLELDAGEGQLAHAFLSLRGPSPAMAGSGVLLGAKVWLYGTAADAEAFLAGGALGAFRKRGDSSFLQAFLHSLTKAPAATHALGLRLSGGSL